MQSPSSEDSTVPAQLVAAAKLLCASRFSPACNGVDVLQIADLLAAAGHREAAARLVDFAYDLLVDNAGGRMSLIRALFADETGETGHPPAFRQ